MTSPLVERAFGWAPTRWAAGTTMLLRGAYHRRLGQLYRSLVHYCWVERVSRTEPLRQVARRVVDEAIVQVRTSSPNAIVASFHRDHASDELAGRFTIAGGGPHDLFRDVIVLKSATAEEKGVILLKYVRTFDAMHAIFDVPRLMERYTFVLEPCWSGYCDPSLLMFIAPGQPVFVQCFTPQDYAFVERIGAPLVPLRLGPADWVNQDLFKPAGAEKRYDVVMVANWAPHKRHALLFHALEKIHDRAIRVLLIGFPWAGRTADDVRRAATSIRNSRVTVDVLESLPADEVARHVSECRAFVFLSKKEGDNKALVEAMFTDVPVVVYEHSIGGATSRVNDATGLLTSEDALADRIRHVLDHPERFSPRRWALDHTGSANATRLLDDAIRRVMHGAGQSYREGIVEKTNSPNLAYKDPGVRSRFAADYDYLATCRRLSSVARRPAVA